jgi:hypothetical protein
VSSSVSLCVVPPPLRASKNEKLTPQKKQIKNKSHSYMPDLLSIKVVGRLPRARRARLYHLLEDESSAQTYQSVIAAPQPPPAVPAA